MTFVELPGYRIKYGKNRALTILRIVSSIPKILIRVKREKAWLERFVAREGVDLVISDNRYGLAIPGVFCVFITHQLLIRTPFGRFADRLLQRMNYRVIRTFSRCWVPDLPGRDALAGELSNPHRLPAIPVRYIGWLSRFGGGGKPVSMVAEAGAAAGMTAAGPELLVLLSGPEPQRTLLEKRVLQQAAGVGCRMVLVRGLPEGGVLSVPVPPAVTVYDHLPAAALERLIAGAELVVARTGYSTVMDLARMGKRAVLIPTPGQTEQEYLGRYLAGKGWAVCVSQKEFSLKDILATGASRWPVEREGHRLRDEVLAVLAQSRPSALG